MPFPLTLKLCLAGCLSLFVNICFGQLKWQNVDAQFGTLPASVHVYKTTDSIEGKPNVAYYVEADLQDKSLEFTVDTTLQRRLKPSEFFEKNSQPLLVVNATFFSFESNKNLNVVIKKGKIVGYNINSVPGRGKDTFTYRHPFVSALGISKKRKPDVAWILTDSTKASAYASQLPVASFKDSVKYPSFSYIKNYATKETSTNSMAHFSKWKMETAIGGGPTLLQDGKVKITNNEELKFGGKAIGDKHPRTAMGYTQDGKLIVLVIQGRFAGIAEGATLTQEAEILKNIGCWEALNLDGGGSSCMLVNGKETITPCDKPGQRPVPAVFMIQKK